MQIYIYSQIFYENDMWMISVPSGLATPVKFDGKAKSLWPTQTCNSLGSCLLQVVLIKVVTLHVQYGRLSMDCALWKKTC